MCVVGLRRRRLSDGACWRGRWVGRWVGAAGLLAHGQQDGDGEGHRDRQTDTRAATGGQRRHSPTAQQNCVAACA